MSRVLYIDCFSGISGDMALGALLDLGAPLGGVLEELAGLGLAGFSIRAPRAMVSGIDGIRAHVDIEGTYEPFHEGTVVAPGAPLTIDLSRPLVAGRSPRVASIAVHDHEHRPFSEIKRLLVSSQLKPRVKSRALAIFTRLAIAEAAVHGTTPDEVAFHEVGSLDAIVDVVGVCAAMELLDIDDVQCAPLPMARGWVDCAHGRMPLPAPAVAELIAGVPVVPDSRKGEWVTPTGAAIATALTSRYGDIPPMTPIAVGYGLGRRDGGQIPNALRLILGEAKAATTQPPVSVIETNIDDMSPQLIARTMEALLEVGALDAWTTPIHMKKGRSAVKVSALAPPHLKEAVIKTLLNESSSIGVRTFEADRVCLSRRFVSVETSGGPVRLKISGADEKWPTVTPEYDDCLAAARASGTPVRIIQTEAIAAGATLLHAEADGTKQD